MWYRVFAEAGRGARQPVLGVAGVPEADGEEAEGRRAGVGGTSPAEPRAAPLPAADVEQDWQAGGGGVRAESDLAGPAAAHCRLSGHADRVLSERTWST